MKKYALSLFSSSGIGDLGLRENGIHTVSACELIEERMKLFHSNYPQAKCFCGDIWKLKDDIIEDYKKRFDTPPFLILATPPCQGMSSNGMGKILSDYRKGLRPKLDERNRLIIPAIDIIKNLQPQWVIFENVANMENTIIFNKNNSPVRIIDYIKQELCDTYAIYYKVIDFVNYGVPQHRKRLITILTKSTEGKKFLLKNNTLLPAESHCKNPSLIQKQWITLYDTIKALPPLRAEIGKNKDSSIHELHKVPLLDEKKLFWLDNTPEGNTAFNNQCINPSCNYKLNKNHGASFNEKGINKVHTTTPLYCEKCGSLLPRPHVKSEDGSLRLMKGYTSAYKRMSWNEPASTLTQNFQYACSDNKIHPSQSRVLSLYEGLIIQTISNYPFSFEINGKLVKDGLIRDTIGESIPPLITDKICKLILKIMNS